MASCRFSATAAVLYKRLILAQDMIVHEHLRRQVHSLFLIIIITIIIINIIIIIIIIVSCPGQRTATLLHWLKVCTLISVVSRQHVKY